MPLVLIVCPIRVSTSSLLEVPASPDKSTNMSSTVSETFHGIQVGNVC
jgi:hypothetical protein